VDFRAVFEKKLLHSNIIFSYFHIFVISPHPLFQMLAVGLYHLGRLRVLEEAKITSENK